MRELVLAIAILSAACTARNSGTTPAPPPLHPYATITPSATSDELARLIVSAERPLPTPTPATYAIKSGDTLSQVAERFRISLDALLAANPGIDPNALRIGEPLLIPASPADLTGGGTLTPVPFPVRQVACHPTANGAVWCFILIQNDTPETLEYVTAQVTLVDSAGTRVDSRMALLPLDILIPGTSLPLSVLFPPPVPLDIEPRVQILTAIQIPTDSARYLPARIQNTVSQVSWLGRTAEVSGEVYLPETSPPAHAVWLAAIAYDASGQVVGWRRWESTSGLPAGARLPFELLVSSVAGPIDRVEFAVQAKP